MKTRMLIKMIVLIMTDTTRVKRMDLLVVWMIVATKILVI